MEAKTWQDTVMKPEEYNLIIERYKAYPQAPSPSGRNELVEWLNKAQAEITWDRARERTLIKVGEWLEGKIFEKWNLPSSPWSILIYSEEIEGQYHLSNRISHRHPQPHRYCLNIGCICSPFSPICTWHFQLFDIFEKLTTILFSQFVSQLSPITTGRWTLSNIPHRGVENH